MKCFTEIIKETNINENIGKSKINLDKLKYLLGRLINDNINVVVECASTPIGFNHLKLDGVDTLTQILGDLIVLLMEDKEVDQKLYTLFESVTYNNNLKEKEKIRLLFRKYKTHEDIINRVTVQSNKMNNGEVAYNRGLAASQLIGLEDFSKSTLNEIHDIFTFRSKQLGYKK